MSHRCWRRTATRPRWRDASTTPAGGSASSASPAMACRRRSSPRSIGLARRFFAEPEGVKAEIAMAHGGAAWRGWFPLDGELTSGRPDHKEGLYFGTELPADHPAVAAGRPLHGANLFPASVPDLRPAVLGWIDAMAALGAALLRGMAIGLGLAGRLVRPARHRRPDRAVPDLPLSARSRPGGAPALGRRRAHRLRLADDPGDRRPRWAAGPRARRVDRRAVRPRRVRRQPRRHARPDDRGPVPVDAAPGSQHERRRSAVVPVLHRPSWDATCPVLPLAGTAPADDADRRWDGRSVRGWGGTYGEYLTAKVAKVFPSLVAESSPPTGLTPSVDGR